MSESLPLSCNATLSTNSNPAIAGNGAVEPEIIKSEGEPTLRVIDPERFNAMPLRLSNGVSGQVLHFQSRNPEHFRQWIEGDLGAEVTLGAQLFAPENAKKLPLVIMVPGSAGRPTLIRRPSSRCYIGKET